MENACEPFQGKKITLLGLGVLGRGVGDAEFLAKCGARVVVTDKKTGAQLAESVEKLKKYPNIEFHLGEHNLEDFTNADMVLKAAGVSVDSPEIIAAREKNIPVAMSTALFAKYAMETGAQIVGVTGTRGKSTVTQMIYQTLAKKFGGKARLGGNVRGLSTLAMLPEVKPREICVLELDSWQLQGFGDLRISPHVAVFTNFMPDHQNYYRDMEEYFSDKANIFRFQKESDTLIVGKSIFEKVNAARPKAAPEIAPALPADWKLNVIGEHNRENAALAAAALRALNLSEEEIKNGIESFEAVEGRLQFVREVRGVKIYNDNNATTPEATIAALRAFGKKIILIAGGSDKGLDLSKLVSEIKISCKKVFLLGGTGTARLQKEFPGAPVFDSLEEAVHFATEAAQSGDVILFSPAFASFGMFGNEYERNDEFLSLVAALI